MKKISILMALMLMLGMTFTSCKDDTQPRLEQPTEFVLNTPPMAENTYILSADNSIELTVSQPDYGMGVVTSYEVQISYTEDFADFTSVKTVGTQAKIECTGEEFAQAMCKLMGYESEETADNYSSDARPVYVRVKAFIPNADYSEITSNIICLKSVVPYPAVPIPAVLYVIGEVSGWDINNGEVKISEPLNGVGGGIYSGVIEFTAEQAAAGFRFYQALGSWGDDGAAPSVGANANDGDNASVAVDDNGLYEGSCTFGKGNWNITNWPGGPMKITVDLNSMKVVFEKAE